jgi:cellulose synthase (UDP-forming)
MSLSAIRPWVVRGVCFVALAASVHYLVWRALHTFNPDAPVLSLLLYGAECYGLVMFLLHVFLTWDTRTLERSLGLRADQDLSEATLAPPAPCTVDVFIPTYNESVALLRNTVLAAREMRLAHKTWVLDDGRRNEVREMCDELGVEYLTRDSNEHAKAGNINAALARTDGELIVVLDADFIPLPALLERTLPHFEDDRLAFVQLPQAFYNVDSIQHVGGDRRGGWHEQTLFYDVIQPGKNRWNAAFWCGSPAVVRREALESVGGAATCTITEDILTSMRMHAAGWRSLYHNEVLAVGVAPGDLDGFRTQRLRWAQGSMQILRTRENPLLKRGLSLPQRLNYFASMVTYFQALQLAVFVAMPALMLMTGESPISSMGLPFFVAFVPYMVATALATKLTGGSSQRMLWDQYFSFLRMFTFLRALLTLVTGGRQLRFKVTPKAPTETTHRRLLYPHVAAAALNVVAVALLLAVPLRAGLDTETEIAVSICAGLVATMYTAAVARLWSRVYRRHHYRVQTSLPATVTAGADTPARGRTENLSFGGASLLLDRSFERGATLTLSLLDGEPISVEATVMSCVAGRDGEHRIGVRFAPLELDDEMRLLFVLLDSALGREPSRPAPAATARVAAVRPALSAAA